MWTQCSQRVRMPLRLPDFRPGRRQRALFGYFYKGRKHPLLATVLHGARAELTDTPRLRVRLAPINLPLH